MNARISVECRTSGEVRLRLRSGEGAAAKAAVPLSTIVMNFKTPRYNCLQSGYGALPKEPRCYTTYARRITREAAAQLEDDFGKNCWFITFTLPGSTRAAIATLAQYSSYVMARVRQWFRDNYEGTEVIAVWELQRRGALHMHLACGCLPSADMGMFALRVHVMWCNLLEFLTRGTNVDLFGRGNGGTWRYRWDKVQTRTERVEKSVSRYLSKYLSKAKTGSWTRESYSPTRWWSCSRKLLAKLRRSRLTWISHTMSHADAGEWFARVSGTACGAAQSVYAIVNEYKPSDRCLSLYFLSGEVAKCVVWSALSQLPGATEKWYNEHTERRMTPASPSQESGGYSLEELMFRTMTHKDESLRHRAQTFFWQRAG